MKLPHFYPACIPVDELICAALRGDGPTWHLADDPATVALFVDRCTQHGVQVLLHARAAQLRWPPAVLASLRQAAMAWALWEERHRHIVGQAVEALAAQGVRPVLFKGTALAYTVYSDAYMRPRADTDLLVASSERHRAAQVLESLGFVQCGTLDCEYVGYEASFVRQEAGLTHMLDLHWRIHYSQVQATRFPYEDLRRDAIPLTRLSPLALGASPVHALLLTCIHRANDLRVPQWSQDQARFGSDRLLWIHDIHLLLRSMSADELRALAHAATTTGTRSVCSEPIQLAIRQFGSPVPESLMAALADAKQPDTVAEYQRQSATRQRWGDLRAVRGAKAKAAFLIEHLAPPPAYMRERYPGARMAPVQLLRVRRLLDGLRKWGRLCEAIRKNGASKAL